MSRVRANASASVERVRARADRHGDTGVGNQEGGSLAQTMTLHLPAEVTSPREARRHVRSLAVNWPAECAAALQVLVDELVTNVVLHARTESTLIAQVDGHRARVEVHDRSRSVPRTRHFALDSLTGRGLHLVEALAHRWGVDEHPDGKVVWFELECDRSAASNGGDVS